ncbi:DPBB and LysM peptidoglycan-binding domain-containing protein [Pontibacter sp. MBLB2868]|uniref:DPBB and LysM peptidoglycan-binding domain-containing protein n=1 Tax=Pontibacter sp. MBLB2868 TaxID=3451555 RepID=UPI003F754B93
MLRTLLVTLAVAPLLSFSANAFDMSSVRDSVGVARKNGKVFVQHKVEPKETLYALSRKYSIPVSQIVDANPSVETTIKIGEIVLIPRKYVTSNAVASAAKTAPAASNRTYTVNETGNKLHTVELNQTLYSISRLHGVGVDDIKRWNGLKDNSISVGAQLIVGKGMANPTKKPVYMPEPDDEMVKPKASESTSSSETTASASVPASKTESATATPSNERIEEKEEEDNTIVKRIVENGMAEMIDPKTDTNKYLALHKTAPVGTIMQVKNAMNNQVVYVRVIGKLPDTGANEKVVVRVSKKAYQKLGAVDQKFRVELSYMP